jgi:transposase
VAAQQHRHLEIGRADAATIIAITGDVSRFRTAASFASFAGTDRGVLG